MQNDRPRAALVVRADGDETLGLGHLMRTSALAMAWRARDGAAHLIGRCPRQLHERFTANGVDVHDIPGRTTDLTDLDATTALLASIGENWLARPWVVVDRSKCDARYVERLRELGCRVVQLDDRGDCDHYVADVVINASLVASSLPYPSRAGTLVLAGPSYALLHRSVVGWATQPKHVPDSAHRILVTFGGADPMNATATVMHAIRRAEIPGAEIVVLVGAANPRLHELQQIADQGGPAIRVLSDVADIGELMSWADMAISAAGGTLWELACIGVPTCLIPIVADQLPNAESADRAGIALSLGSIEHFDEALLARRLSELSADRLTRDRMRASAREVVDGRGVERVIDIMEAIDGTNPHPVITVRPVCSTDSLALWRLANDADVRSNSFRPEAIPLEGHRDWFESRLSSSDTVMWLAELAGVAVGQIRYERTHEKTVEVYFAVARAFRGRGLGTRLLKDTVANACRIASANVVKARVFTDNPASTRTFLKAGFRTVGRSLVHGRSCDEFELAGAAAEASS